MNITFEDNHLCRALYGEREHHLRILEKVLSLKISARGNEVELKGDPERMAIAKRVLRQLYRTLEKGFSIFPDDVRQGAQGMLEENAQMDLSEVLTDTILVTHQNRHLTPRSFHQKSYIDAMRQNDLVFGIGPAGTGKTYLAMAMAVAALSKKKVQRIILVRPAVEAGERLGFLPGSLQDKIDPYLRPLYDALYDMVGNEKAESYISRGVVEVAPLAFMRGRTLNSAFVILDEAQNTSGEQMKMFLTRLGFGSQAVVTGDITQIDLPNGVRSGLVQCRRVLQGVEGISFSHFDENDVIRHPLVQRIVHAYARDDQQRKAMRKAASKLHHKNKEQGEEAPVDE